MSSELRAWKDSYRQLWRRDPGAAYFYAGWVAIFVVEAVISAAFGVLWLALLGVVGVVAAAGVLASKILFDDDSLLALAKLPGRLRRRRGAITSDEEH
jgi:hypothetical protein